jgi:hypothetical protein
MEDNNIKQILKQELFVYINKKIDIMKLSTVKLNDENYIPILNSKQLWSKKELGDVIKLFNIRRIEYADSNSQIPLSELYIRRTESYERAIKSCHHMYIKKIIFLLKKTLNLAYLKILEKQKYIILAKADSDKGTVIDFFCMKKTKIIPIFSDSSEVEAFFITLDKKAEDIQNEYSSLNIRFKDLYKLMIEKYKDYALLIDPSGTIIKNFSFSMLLNRKLLNYMRKEHDSEVVTKK